MTGQRRASLQLKHLPRQKAQLTGGDDAFHPQYLAERGDHLVNVRPRDPGSDNQTRGAQSLFRERDHDEAGVVGVGLVHGREHYSTTGDGTLPAGRDTRC